MIASELITKLKEIIAVVGSDKIDVSFEDDETSLLWPIGTVHLSDDENTIVLYSE